MQDQAWLKQSGKTLQAEADAAAKGVAAAYNTLMNDPKRSLANREAYQVAVDYQTSVATVRAELAWW